MDLPFYGFTILWIYHFMDLPFYGFTILWIYHFMDLPFYLINIFTAQASLCRLFNGFIFLLIYPFLKLNI
jgi:hypothetical protein